MTDATNTTIVPCPPGMQAACLRLLFADLAENVRESQIQSLLSEQQQDPQALAGLLAAVRAHEVTGAILARPLGGRTAFIWPARERAGDEALADRLLEAAGRWCGSSDTVLLQALPAAGATGDHQRLLRGGFWRAADLLYLLCPGSTFPTAAPETGLSFESCDQVGEEGFARVVQATYAATLDCPAIDGLRDMDDVLQGYRCTGQYDPKRWLIARRGKQDVGCVILSEDSEHDHWELVYMGVVPEARGEQLGLAIVRQAQWLAHRAGRSRMVLSVDAANGPAIDMYARAGFSAWDERPVFIKQLND